MRKEGKAGDVKRYQKGNVEWVEELNEAQNSDMMERECIPRKHLHADMSLWEREQKVSLSGGTANTPMSKTHIPIHARLASMNHSFVC